MKVVYPFTSPKPCLSAFCSKQNATCVQFKLSKASFYHLLESWLVWWLNPIFSFKYGNSSKNELAFPLRWSLFQFISNPVDLYFSQKCIHFKIEIIMRGDGTSVLSCQRGSSQKVHEVKWESISPIFYLIVKLLCCEQCFYCWQMSQYCWPESTLRDKHHI